MKKMLHTLAAVLVALTAQAQTLNVSVGSVTDQYPSAQTGEMTFTGGTQMTVMGKTYDISQIGKMWTDQTQVKDNEVNVVYSGDAALVYVAGNIARYVTATVSGAHVSLTQSADITNDLINDGTFSEITYNLSGTSTDGSLTLGGTAKCTVAVNGLELTNPNGAPINITNGKRVDLSVKKGSTNTLKDGTASTAKGCLYCKGHLELKGKGTLNVYAYGSAAHGIKSGDYLEMKNCTVNILAATKDGVSCNEYFLMESGELNISGTGDDGIQCDLDGTTSTGELTDHEDEDTGNIYLEGGTINIAVTADAAKGIKASGDVRISDGSITVKATGNAVWDTDDSEVKGSSCISADGNMTISGGTLVLTNSGSGGKGIKADGTLTISDAANIDVTTTGQIAYCSSTTNTTIRTATSSNTTERLDDALHTSPKGIKADGAMTITGGTINVSASYHEAIETKGTLDIKGGYIYAYSGDDAINSKSTMNISGGYIMANSSGNDGLDANGNLNISGGTVVAVSASGAEVGIDAAEQYKLNITGGNIIAIGGLERGYTMNGTAYQAASYNKGAWYGFYDNSGQLITAFKVPSNSNMGTPMVVYTSTGKPSVMSGVTGSGDSFWNGNGYSSCSGGTSVSLTTYTSSSGGGGGGGRPGR
jgi:hypothetical protein